MVISMEGFKGESDPARLAAQVVSGMGFIGAGAIMHDSMGGVKGITTAASLWVTAMIGLACGNGFYFGAGIGVILTVISLVVIRHYEGKMFRKPIIINAVCEIELPAAAIVFGILEEYNNPTVQFSINNFTKGQKHLSKVNITFPNARKKNENMRVIISRIRKELNPIEFNINIDE